MNRKKKVNKTVQQREKIKKATLECINVISVRIFSDQDNSEFPTGLK